MTLVVLLDVNLISIVLVPLFTSKNILSSLHFASSLAADFCKSSAMINLALNSVISLHTRSFIAV